MQAYAEICIGAYIAYLAYICTPHFADGAAILSLTTDSNGPPVAIRRPGGRGPARVHQGCAMDVLARIESVNMYWYVWVCILACILVRIGMYQLGTY